MVKWTNLSEYMSERYGIERTEQPRPPVAKVTRRLYWAYGSNINTAQMERRCPTAQFRRALYVNDMALVLRGVADVVPRMGSRCPGALWSITERDEEALDRFEGVKNGVYRKSYFKLRGNKKVYRVLFYQKNDSSLEIPSDRYINTIEEGYRDVGLDATYLDRAIRECWFGNGIEEYLAVRRSLREEPTMTRDLIVPDGRPYPSLQGETRTGFGEQDDTSVEPSAPTILMGPP